MDTIFISYAREDQEIVLSIYKLLRNHGFYPWIDVVDLLPGQNWDQEVEKAIRKCRFFLACLSTNSVSKRGYVQSEFKKAFKILEMIPEEDVFLIPIRLDDCKIPFSFSNIHVLDYFVDNGPQRLIETFNICQGFGKDSTLLLKEFTIDSHNAEVLSDIAKKSSMHDKVIALLEEALKVRKDPSERYWIYATLGKIGGNQAMRILENGLNEVNEFSKQGAQDGIELILRKVSDH